MLSSFAAVPKMAFVSLISWRMLGVLNVDARSTWIVLAVTRSVETAVDLVTVARLTILWARSCRRIIDINMTLSLVLLTLSGRLNLDDNGLAVSSISAKTAFDEDVKHFDRIC